MSTPLPLLSPTATENPPARTSSIAEPHSTPAPLRQGPVSIDSLYVHVPFCFHKCHYCDFYSIVDQNDRQAVFTRRLIEEIQLRAGQVTRQPRTLFVGGGTPTLLRTELWEQLLTTLRQVGTLDHTLEFTVEANPETVTPQLLATLKAGGVNRISIGAQSFNPQLLQTLERWHDPANVTRAVRMTRDAGITNINIDLIFSIPGQTLDTLDADLNAALSLEPDHLSYYGLTYEPHTPLAARQARGQIIAIDEALERRMYEHVMDRLAQAGYEHYEVSNWAKPAMSCRHNLNYWHNKNWLGVGPAAASHINGTRWKNVAHLGQYLSQTDEPPTTDHEHLPATRHVGEQLMLRLRLRQGVAQKWLKNHLPNNDPRWAVITEWMDLGMLEQTDTHLRLTPQGLFVADTVIGKLL